MTLLVMVSFVVPTLQMECATLAIAHLVWLVARVRLHRMQDQQYARILHGRVCVALVLLAWSAGFAWLQHCPSAQPAPAGTVAVFAQHCLLSWLYLHHSAIEYRHRLSAMAISLVSMGLMPDFSTLGRPAEPCCMSGALLLGELIGHTLVAHRRKRHLEHQTYMAVDKRQRELGKVAHEARQRELNMALRYSRALKHISNVVIELHANGHLPCEMRESVCTLGSASFEPTFGRPCDETAGLLFELVAQEDAAALEAVLAVEPEAEGRDPNNDRRRYRSAIITFVRPDGEKRRMRFQVTELTHSQVCEHLTERRPYVHAALSCLLLVCSATPFASTLLPTRATLLAHAAPAISAATAALQLTRPPPSADVLAAPRGSCLPAHRLR
jgi:hypothetical protein